jgi:lipopolysaccharide/colanic/teichoic acid biosynthesis glycosyltransferase
MSAISWVTKINPDKAILKGKAYHITKRIMDLALVIGSVIFTVPVIAVIALMVKLTSPGGPVFFSQIRTGKGGRRFKMYKFRTMVPNAEELKKELAHLNELDWPDFKVTNDPRITKVGNILRKTSLDELPQLLNVLAGDMSLVGPRPTSFSADTYKIWHTERLDVVPGLTGLWQIISRGESEFDDRLALDITYINHRCLQLDIEILFRTIFAVLKQKGAK